MSLANAAFIGLLSVILFVTAIWVISVMRRDASIVDRVWGLAFVLLAGVYCWLSPATNWRGWLVFSLVTLWGTRLSLHIHYRNRGHGEDYRYQAMRSRHGSKFWWYSYLTVFLLQAVLAFVISAPLLMTAYQADPQHLTFFDVAGLLLWVIGFAFEAIGDHQLAAFKSNPANRGKLLTSGLWSLTRHPNYFGDATLWWGYFLFALSVPYGYVTVFGPLLMSFFLLKVSGARLLEKKLVKSKPGYEEYMRNTPEFIPRLWPRQRH